MQAQGRDFGIFVIEQSPKNKFNRGALLNAGVLLLAGSGYDHFCFHDVDTIPTEVSLLHKMCPVIAGKCNCQAGLCADCQLTY